MRRAGAHRELGCRRPGIASWRTPWGVLVWLALAGCDHLVSAEQENFRASPLRPREPAATSSLFTQFPATETGIDFKIAIDAAHRQAFLFATGFACGGVCLGDVNGDDRPDIFFVNGPGDNALYLQRADFKFERAHAPGLAGGDRWGAGAALADVDNDGDLDFYVCNYEAPNQLFLNDGKGSFAEVSGAAGLDVADASLMAYFADVDGDADLDVYLLQNRLERPGGRPAKPPYDLVEGKPVMKPDFAKYYGLRQNGENSWMMDFTARPDRLYLNQGRDAVGKLRFLDITSTAGVRDHGHGLSAVWFDYDTDGDQDLYVCNDYADPDAFYRNDGVDPDGVPRFTDVIADTVPQTSWFSMGSDVADLDGDGRLDLFTADMAATNHFKAKVMMGDMSDKRWWLENAWPRQIMRNQLFINTGSGRFLEAAFMAGVARSDWSWAVKLADFDADGRTDIFITNGLARTIMDGDYPLRPEDYIGKTEWDLAKHRGPLREEDVAFRNLGALKFENAGKAWGLNNVGMSYAAAYGDLDRDGDLDLVVANLDEPPSIYRNNSTDGHRLLVKLRGRTSHPSGWGAIVQARTASGAHTVPMNPCTGFLSSNDPDLFIGLGSDKIIPELTVRWPSGHEQVFHDVAADQRLVITEPEGRPKDRAVRAAARPLFAENAGSLGLDFRHIENEFDDYTAQPLLPGKLSRFGPGVALADLNGDGRDDVFVGGATDQAGGLFLSESDGQFRKVRGPWEQDAASEDMGVLFFEADGDGDADLLVASGSVESPRGTSPQRDRLYLNESAGGDVRFVNAPRDALADDGESNQCVVAADFDGDEDLDLFVGARSVPGVYPQTPDSRLLRNDSCPGAVAFANVTEQVAPGLRKAGLVTGALWSDVDGDARPDLLVTCEWGPVKLFLNRGGRLEDATSVAGLAERKGWWNSITAIDADGDGDLDYAAMNAGVNTKYGEPNSEHPSLLYAGDMEANGRLQLVEAKPGDNGELPVRGRSCSSAAMPSLRKKFPTFRAFAASTLGQIYGEDRLSSAQRLAATSFESGLLINDSAPGQPKFRWKAFPRLAQISPGFGISCTDFDADGHLDLAIAQNLFSREPETGLWRGGLGCLLRGTGEGEFAVVGLCDSGLSIPGDGKGLAVGDLDANGWPDLVATQNNDRLLAFVHQKRPERELLTVRLNGKRANPTVVGARVILVINGNPSPAQEVAAGSGYLSQSTSALFFGGWKKSDARMVKVRWPDGRQTQTKVPSGSTRIMISRP